MFPAGRGTEICDFEGEEIKIKINSQNFAIPCHEETLKLVQGDLFVWLWRYFQNDNFFGMVVPPNSHSVF